MERTLNGEFKFMHPNKGGANTTRRYSMTVETDGPVSVSQLTNHAHYLLVTRMKGFGVVLSEDHKDYLRRVLGFMAETMLGGRTGRHVVPLPTGGGKTQAILAFVYAIHELGLGQSVMVCAERVEVLSNMKRDLLEAGVPEGKLGLLHSYDEEKGYLPSTEGNHERQFLLCTHARLRHGRNWKTRWDEAMLYKGEERDIMLWDEALIVSRGEGVALRDVKAALEFWKSMDDHALAPALESVAERVGALQAHYARLATKEEQSRGVAVEFPLVPYDVVSQFRRNAASYRKAELAEGVVQFLEMDGELRLAPVAGVPTVLQTTPVLPKLPEKVVVFDASYDIREMVQRDPNLRRMPHIPMAPFSCEQVEVHCFRHPAGCEKTTEKIASIGREVAYLCKEVIPEDEAILIVTFKDRSKSDVESDLRAALAREGVDLDATVLVDVQSRNTLLPEMQVMAEKAGRSLETKPRIVILNWGNETSHSEFSYCGNVILAGILHRSNDDIAATMLGQSGAMDVKITESDISSVRDAEVAHHAYQAINRGRARIIRNGRAAPMKVWMWSGNIKGLRSRLQTVMRDVRFHHYTPKYMEEMGKEEAVVDDIVRYVSGLPETGVSRISSRELRQRIDPDRTIPDRSWSRYFARAVELLEEEGYWMKDKASLIYRVPFLSDTRAAA
jgi:hypothetical protein